MLRKNTAELYVECKSHLIMSSQTESLFPHSQLSSHHTGDTQRNYVYLFTSVHLVTYNLW